VLERWRAAGFDGFVTTIGAASQTAAALPAPADVVVAATAQAAGAGAGHQEAQS